MSPTLPSGFFREFLPLSSPSVLPCPPSLVFTYFAFSIPSSPSDKAAALWRTLRPSSPHISGVDTVSEASCSPAEDLRVRGLLGVLEAPAPECLSGCCRQMGLLTHPVPPTQLDNPGALGFRAPGVVSPTALPLLLGLGAAVAKLGPWSFPREGVWFRPL